MRIVHLVAGAGSMYCGTCLQGNTLVAALRQLGADVLLAPLYTPLRTDEPSQSGGRLALGGYLDPGDRPYLARLRSRAGELGLGDRFEYVGELDLAGKIAFLRALDLFCFPCLFCESKALPLLEAWAQGLPAVVPAVGPMPELVDDTGGGLLYESADPGALARSITDLLLNPDLAAQCGRRAQEAGRERYTARRMGEEMLALYRDVTD